ncbi:UDP-glucosyltransferase 2-like [Choristoneura fumiferana]|uniref:UDP-glucosyltransferase 2-like n=1 Tax=Choristoneura fumiferana TaxID=7141 RepID=UPI003D158DE6
MLRSLFIFSTLAALQVSDTARIFAWFPMPSISHQVVFRPLTQELAKRGHEVVVMTPDPAFPKGQTPANLTEIDVHDVSYGAWRDIFMSKQKEMTDDLDVQVMMLYTAMMASLETQLNTTEMKALINGNEQFDLLLIEGVVLPALAITHVIKAPVILVNSLGGNPTTLANFGAPIHPFLYPFCIQKRVFNLTIWDKIQQLLKMGKMASLDRYFYSMTRDALSRHFGDDLPPLEELEKNVDLLLINENPVWSEARPLPSNVVYIGGIHKNPKKDLPEDLKAYLDSSKHGVIYMSFGTNVDPSVLPPEKIQAFIKAFSALPYDVLWKWNEDELPGRTSNIRISKWLPQSDLLYHPKIKLFITQGGLQSTDEAINAGVPLIGVPVLADQWYNVEHYVHHGVGLQLDIKSVNAEIVKNAIETVIGDPSYRQNMLKIRDLMNDQPMSPLDRAVWWTEHVLRHGGTKHLRSPAWFLTWRQYYEVDLIVIVLGSLLLTLVVAIVTVRYLVLFLIRIFTKRVKVKRS